MRPVPHAPYVMLGLALIGIADAFYAATTKQRTLAYS
jgi:hypothetical protein